MAPTAVVTLVAGAVQQPSQATQLPTQPLAAACARQAIQGELDLQADDPDVQFWRWY